MFDEKEFIRIMKSEGGLEAVKYMKTETGLSLKECKAYLDKQKKAEVWPSIGTITWFKCEDRLPPKDENGMFGYSIEVLVTDRRHIQESVYCHNPAQGEPYWHTTHNLNPTHWAYINLPE